MEILAPMAQVLKVRIVMHLLNCRNKIHVPLVCFMKSGLFFRPHSYFWLSGSQIWFWWSTLTYPMARCPNIFRWAAKTCK
jgi:hypothetical protein